MLEPISKSDWNKFAAAHLLSRAGFGAPASEIDAAAARSPEDVVADLVDFERVKEHFDAPAWAVGEHAADRVDKKLYKEMRELSADEKKAKQKELRQTEQEQIRELRGWWLKQMRFTKRPLQEKLTLFWHGHWASSAEKVKSSYALFLQNETLRKMANGNFHEMTVAMAKDPAMLIYLDNAQSRSAHPNENFARELMELFTLGIGNYTEDDIKNSARAFTGWSVGQEKLEFQNRRFIHDDGEKTFMGRKGNFDGGDIISIILDQPACAPYIAKKLWTFFAYENPAPELVDKLAATLRESKWDLKPMLKQMFLSKEFYSKTAVRTQIKSPVQWLVGTARMLDSPLPDADTCNGILFMLGQVLFAPPSVKGWDGGYAWITTNSLFSRYNFAGILIKGGKLMTENAPDMMGNVKNNGSGNKQSGQIQKVIRAMANSASLVDCAKVLPPAARTDKDHALACLEWQLYRAELTDKENAELRESLAKMPDPEKWSDDEIRTILHTMMSTPFYQLT